MWKRASDNILEIFFKVLDGKEDHRGCGPHKATLQTELKAFGDLFERHIRCEERELFPFYEAHIPEAEAARLGAAITRLTAREGRPASPPPSLTAHTQTG